MTNYFKKIKIDAGDFSKLSPQVKFLIFFQLSILFILSILIGVIFSPKFQSSVKNQSGQQIRDDAAEYNNILYISPEKEEMFVGETQIVSVVYSGEEAGAIDSFIDYDPSHFRVEAIDNGEVFDTILDQSVEGGLIQFSAGLSPGSLGSAGGEDSAGSEDGVLEAGTSGEITFYTFTIEALSPADSSTFRFNQDLTQVGIGGKNRLSEAKTGSITIFEAQE